MILVISCMIMKIIKSLGVEMWYSMRRACTKINYKERNRKQTSVALSTTEVEYIVAYSTCSEVVWLRELLSGLFDLELDATCIYCDNQSFIKLAGNPMFHDKSKQIDIKYQYIHDMVEKGVVKLQYVSIDEQVAYVLTKSLSKVNFEYFRDKLGVV